MFKRLTSAMVAVLALVSLIAPTSFVRAAEAESTAPIRFMGQLIELSSTDVPTTIIVRKDPTGAWTDYTVDINSSTTFGTSAANTTVMADWITGDYLAVDGSLNENTGVVTATKIVDTSLDPTLYLGLNGWIDSIDTASSTMQVQWNGELNTVNITSNTHMVVGGTNPAALTDFQVGDRVRLRLIKESAIGNEARIIVVLRRGDDIFLKARTRGFTATLNEIVDNGDGTGSIGVTLLANAHLRSGDVNNLVGVEGDELVVTFDNVTKLVRKFSGETTIDEFQEGDTLFVVGRVNDDDTISARLIKDTSITKDMSGTGSLSASGRQAGKITALDTSTNTLTVTGVRGGGAEWAVTYGDDATFELNGESATEADLAIGDFVRMEGTIHLSAHTFTATSIVARNTFPILEEHEADEADESVDNEDSGSTEDTESEDTSDSSDDTETEDGTTAEFDIEGNEIAV